MRRSCYLKRTFKFGRAGGEEKAFQGASPLPPPRGLQLLKGYEEGLWEEKKINPKIPPKRWFGLSLGKKQNPDPKKREGSAVVVVHNEGGAAAQRPPVAAPRWERTGPGHPQKVDTAVPPRTAATRQWFLYVRGFFF